MNERGDKAYNFVIVGIILSVLEVVAVDDSTLALISFDLPVVEIDFLE